MGYSDVNRTFCQKILFGCHFEGAPDGPDFRWTVLHVHTFELAITMELVSSGQPIITQNR